MRLQYRHPKIYDYLISFLYSDRLLKRFSETVGKHKKVFDVAAGYGRMSRFIDTSNSYYGIDLNRKFVEHGQTEGVNLEIKNIFDPQAYKESDIFVLVDIVHHLTPESLRQLFDLVFSHAKEKIIVIEPAFVNLSARHGFLGQLVDLFFKKIDDDGINKITRWFTEEEYIGLFKSKFGSALGHDFSLRYEKIDKHYFVVFVKQ